MKSLLTVITLIFGLVFVQVQTFAALPNTKSESPISSPGGTPLRRRTSSPPWRI